MMIIFDDDCCVQKGSHTPIYTWFSTINNNHHFCYTPIYTWFPSKVGLNFHLDATIFHLDATLDATIFIIIKIIINLDASNNLDATREISVGILNIKLIHLYEWYMPIKCVQTKYIYTSLTIVSNILNTKRVFLLWFSSNLWSRPWSTHRVTKEILRVWPMKMT